MSREISEFNFIVTEIMCLYCYRNYEVKVIECEYQGFFFNTKFSDTRANFYITCILQKVVNPTFTIYLNP